MVDFRYSETPVLTLGELGHAIRSKRKASGLRIDDAAALCGVSVDLLSRLENGKSGVATDRVLKVLMAQLTALQARVASWRSSYRLCHRPVPGRRQDDSGGLSRR